MAQKRARIFSGAAPYGTYEGPQGGRQQWRGAFGEAMNGDEAKAVVGTGSPWEILGVAPGSAFAVIKAAFYKLIQIHHPDKGGNKEVCQRIIAAWTVLKENVK